MKWASGEAPVQAQCVIFINLSKSFIHFRMNHVLGNETAERRLPALFWPNTLN